MLSTFASASLLQVRNQSLPFDVKTKKSGNPDREYSYGVSAFYAVLRFRETLQEFRVPYLVQKR